MYRNQSDIRKAMFNGELKTSATGLPLLNAEGLNNIGKLYVYNNTTAAVYYNIRSCGINTSTTSYWGTVATATVATGVITSTNITLPGAYNTVEFSGTATGAGSALIAMHVW